MKWPIAATSRSTPSSHAVPHDRCLSGGRELIFVVLLLSRAVARESPQADDRRTVMLSMEFSLGQASNAG